jgi:hypothetical protein
LSLVAKIVDFYTRVAHTDKVSVNLIIVLIVDFKRVVRFIDCLVFEIVVKKLNNTIFFNIINL